MMRTVVREVVRSFRSDEQDRVVFHLPASRSERDAEWIPVRCGGGIVFHSPLEKVEKDEVCPDCLAGRVTI